MKRSFDTFSNEQELLCNNDTSWLERLAHFQRGVLLAKILRNLEKPDLLLMYHMSKIIYIVCQRYQMLERLDTGSVFMFGNGAYGLLGDGDTSGHIVEISRRIQNINKIANLSCGGYYTGIVTVEGYVYMFGNGKSGRLGDGDTNPHSVGIPRQIPHIPKIATISCGSGHTGILTVDGDVYMFGNGSHGRLGDGDIYKHYAKIPRQIQNIPKISAVSCGYSHTGILTIDGDMYMFGRGRCGVLGDGNTSDHFVGVPRQIQKIPKVVVVSCSILHTGIVTVDGDVYMCGNGYFGILGDNDITNHAVGIPQKIQNIPKAVALSCGDAHNGIVTRDGDVYMFGHGRDGMLGDGDINHHIVAIPTKIQNIPKVATISCGMSHTGIVTIDGDVYMFGHGKFGRLGDGDFSNHNVGIPKRVQGIPKASSISCGIYHTGIITIPENSLNLTIY